MAAIRRHHRVRIVKVGRREVTLNRTISYPSILRAYIQHRLNISHRASAVRQSLRVRKNNLRRVHMIPSGLLRRHLIA